MILRDRERSKRKNSMEEEEEEGKSTVHGASLDTAPLIFSDSYGEPYERIDGFTLSCLTYYSFRVSLASDIKKLMSLFFVINKETSFFKETDVFFLFVLFIVFFIRIYNRKIQE